MNVAEISNTASFAPVLWRSSPPVGTWVAQPIDQIRISPDYLVLPTDEGEDFTLSIEIPAFDARLAGEIVDLQSNDDYSEIMFTSVVDVGVTGVLKIFSEPSTGPYDRLRIREASLTFDVSEPKARPLFIADTLYAMLAMGGQARLSIQRVKVDLTLNFNIRLSDLSELLQRRKLYFALMVLEKATETEFDVPEFISGEDMSAIFFSARAILDREFIWRVNEIVVPTPANDETFRWIEELPRSPVNQSAYKMMFGPTPIRRAVLGQKISVGLQTVFLEDAVIGDEENVKSALASRNGRVVTVRIKPLSRIGRYVFSDVPRFSDDLWDDHIKRFIETEPILSHGLINRYLAMMSLVIPERPPEQIYALINPETVGLLAEQARERRMPVDDYLMSLLHQFQPNPSSGQIPDDQFEADMVAFADGTDNVVPYKGSYSRSDIYFDHD